MFSLMETSGLDYALRPIRSKSKRLNHISTCRKRRNGIFTQYAAGTSARMFAWPAPGLPKAWGAGPGFLKLAAVRGINLLWLGSKGFHNLYGADLSQEAVCLGKYLARHLDLPLSIWQDNSLEPKKVPHDLDGLISLNWLYHCPM